MNTNAEKDYGKILGELGLDTEGVDAIQSMQMGIARLYAWFVAKAERLEAKLRAGGKVNPNDLGALCMAYSTDGGKEGDSVVNTGVGSVEMMLQCWRGILSGMMQQIGAEKVISLMAFIAAEERAEQRSQSSHQSSNVVEFPAGGKLQ